MAHYAQRVRPANLWKIFVLNAGLLSMDWRQKNPRTVQDAVQLAHRL